MCIQLILLLLESGAFELSVLGSGCLQIILDLGPTMFLAHKFFWIRTLGRGKGEESPCLCQH
jgi:hypothetical protein